MVLWKFIHSRKQLLFDYVVVVFRTTITCNYLKNMCFNDIVSISILYFRFKEKYKERNENVEEESKQILKYATTHNHPQPSTIIHKYPELPRTTRNHIQPSTTTHNLSRLSTITHNHPQPPTTICNHPQPTITIHNHPQPLTVIHKKPLTTTHTGCAKVCNHPQPSTNTQKTTHHNHPQPSTIFC